MPVITLIPGLACDAQLWRAQIAALAPLGPVRVADVHARGATLPEMAAALLADADGDLHLVGTSMGGMIALEAARQSPARVRSLALLATSARPDTPELLKLRGDAIGLFEQGRVREVLQANLGFAFHPAHAAALAADYLAMVERAGAPQLIAQNRAVMARADLRPTLPGIRCPTLVACGRDDRLTPPEHSQEIAAAIPGARLAVIAGARHLTQLESPALFNAHVAAFLEDIAFP